MASRAISCSASVRWSTQTPDPFITSLAKVHRGALPSHFLVRQMPSGRLRIAEFGTHFGTQLERREEVGWSPDHEAVA